MLKKNLSTKLSFLHSRTTPETITIPPLTLTISPNVYPTSLVSTLIIDSLPNTFDPSTRILDYGTGSGYLAICAALRGASVVASDINPDAIKCARSNAEKYNVAEKIDFRPGDAFSTINTSTEKFDYILSGLPWDDGKAKSLLDRSMIDPGLHMRKELLDNAKKVLKENAYMLLTYSEAAEKRTPLLNSDPRYKFEIANQKIIDGEPHYAICMRANDRK